MQEHLKIVEAVARKAGQFIMNEQTRFKNDRVEKKGHNDFVSYVDRGAEEIIVSG
ncbi:MAG: myo-inositol-1(or 4)-monophosphatase, partial [Flavobacteriales bacterium]